MERKSEQNRVGKLLRAAIEHDKAGLIAYGSMTNLERIGRLRARYDLLNRKLRAAERAAGARIVTPPVNVTPMPKPSRLESLKRTIKSFFNRGNR